jgi:hypothetical protein
VGRRTVARTLPGSLQRTLSARTLRSPRGKATLRVVAKLGEGQPHQVVLSRPRPRCGA